MGVITSVPTTIKIQIQDIQLTKSEYVLDSTQYENNYHYVRRACIELSKNKSIQKVILKLFFPSLSTDEDLTKVISKLLETKGIVIIYGINLHFFNHPKWIKIWTNSKCTNLQIKFEMMPEGFEYLAQGLTYNKNIRILGFRYLSDNQLIRLSECVSTNTSIFHIQIILENRLYTMENMDEGIYSPKVPSSPQVSMPISFLSQSRSVSVFTIGGYQDRATFISGILRNRSIKTLVLDSIDVEKHLRHDFNLAFKENHCIEEVKCLRGLNTLSSMILFQSLRKNKTITSLQLEDSIFYDHGFLALEALLKSTTSLKRVTFKNLLHLNISKFSQNSPLNNLCKILSGLSENKSVIEMHVLNHPHSSNEIQFLEQKERTLAKNFAKLLKENQSLKTLCIENFRLGSESFPGIVEGISENSTLQILAIKGNLIGWLDLLRFLRAIMGNKVLHSIDFRGNALVKEVGEISGEVFAEIFQILKDTNLKNFGIETWFWNLTIYPSSIFGLICECKQKYAENSCDKS